LFLLVLSWTVFLGFAVYYTDDGLYYPEGDVDASPSVGYSWIWYHLESWVISLVIDLGALVMLVYGLVLDIVDSNWKLSDYVKIEIAEEDEEELD
jgi:hypothetical protein